jgi:hypothetical protein
MCGEVAIGCTTCDDDEVDVDEVVGGGLGLVHTTHLALPKLCRCRSF